MTTVAVIALLLLAARFYGFWGFVIVGFLLLMFM